MGAEPTIRMEHDFTVDVPLENAWGLLSDPGVLAASIPGGELRPVDGRHVGRVELDAARSLACVATISVVDHDDDDHVVTMSVHGRQLGGPGLASATLRSQVLNDDASTHVLVRAEVIAAGHQPGAGFERDARQLFDAIAQELQQRAQNAPPPRAAPEARAAHYPVPVGEPAGRTPHPQSPAPATRRQTRRVVPAAGALIAIALLRRRRRTRRRWL